MDDRRVGQVIRAIRRRRGLRQIDVAHLARVGQSTVSRIERGHVDDHPLRMVRAVARALQVQVDLAPSWRGAALDRLLDEDHAALSGVVATLLERLGWDIAAEVTYSRYGERGSIDLLGVHARTRAALVVEIKTQLVSIEAMGRKLDEKARLAPAIVLERLGVAPAFVGRLVVLPDRSTERRRADRHAALLGRMLPTPGRDVRAWLRRPSGLLAGLWFVSVSHPRTRKSLRPGPDRVRLTATATTRARSRAAGASVNQPVRAISPGVAE